MRERIDIQEAIRLYEELRNWRKVALYLARKTAMPFTPGAVCNAVRQHDLQRQQ